MSTTLNMAPGRPEKKSGSERRRSERKPHEAQAWLFSPTATDAKDKLDAMSLNLSRHGIGFQLACPLAIDAYFIIEVGVGTQRICSEVRVVSCARTEIGLYEVGAEFC